MFFGKYQTTVSPNMGPILGVIPKFKKDYGANWGTSATITADLATAAKDFDMAILVNTNATGGGMRVYATQDGGTKWYYVAMTAVS